MEVVRTRGAAVEEANVKCGYASTYSKFNFAGLEQDREELLYYALDRLEMLKEIHNQIERKAKPDDILQTARMAEKKHRLSITTRVCAVRGKRKGRKERCVAPV